MCSLRRARSLGFALVPLATCCIVANLLLFFPDGRADLVKTNNLSKYVWFFMGIGGGGLAILVTAVSFLSLEQCAKTCGTDTCAMCGSVLPALLGVAGSVYCFIISGLALLEGPYCFTSSGWRSPFENIGPKYLFSWDTWSECRQPVHIVEWNVTLLCIQLGLSTLEFLICTVQLLSGLVHAVCRPCCYTQEYRLNG
ncbi:transmembrane 4 L6 family member 1 [Brachyhypopomus gauderio]|uniref:transmembrane 4 L6 family member 1 n=1 Tax=Brachyhypopomus gauderio TaxID=698409 RepID=UPI00404174BB